MSSRRMTSIVLTRHVRQQRHLACALDRDRDLALVPAARAGDPAVADLALLGDVAAQLVDVLVVDLVDLVLAEEAGLPLDRPRLRALAPATLVSLAGTFVCPLSHSILPRTGCRRRQGRRSRRWPAPSPPPGRTGARRRPRPCCRGTAPIV